MIQIGLGGLIPCDSLCFAARHPIQQTADERQHQHLNTPLFIWVHERSLTKGQTEILTLQIYEFREFRGGCGGRETWEALSSKASTAVMPERTELMGLLKERRRWVSMPVPMDRKSMPQGPAPNTMLACCWFWNRLPSVEFRSGPSRMDDTRADWDTCIVTRISGKLFDKKFDKKFRVTKIGHGYTHIHKKSKSHLAYRQSHLWLIWFNLHTCIYRRDAF